MGEPEAPFDAVAHALAYKFALAAGIGHRESVRHATLEARAERDPGGFARIMSNLATPAGA